MIALDDSHGWASLGRCRLDEASFRGASMIGAQLAGLRAFAAGFQQAHLAGAVFDDANLERVAFTSAELGGASFVDVVALGGECDRQRAIGARFDVREADLSPTTVASGPFMTAAGVAGRCRRRVRLQRALRRPARCMTARS